MDLVVKMAVAGYLLDLASHRHIHTHRFLLSFRGLLFSNWLDFVALDETEILRTRTNLPAPPPHVLLSFR